MEIVKRYPNVNIYDIGKGQMRSVIGGIPNTPCDIHGNLAPLDNRVKVDLSHPIVKYLIRQGPFEIGFHNKNNNKYLVGLQLRTGERLVKTLVGDIACTPTVRPNQRTMRWTYPNGCWIEEYATESQIKEMVFQKAGVQIRFKYNLTGLTGHNGVGEWKFKNANGKIVFKIQKPYYCTEGGEFLSWVPVSWEKIEDDYIVTYPAPQSDCYIDPVIVFGDVVGGIGNNKDTNIYQGQPANSYGAQDYFRAGLANANENYYGLLRFDLSSIPANAIVNTAVLSLTLFRNLIAGGFQYWVSELITNWGITPINEGGINVPAAANEATYDESFAGATPWAALGGFDLANDANAAEDTFTVLAGDLPGTVYNLNIPVMAQNWLITNYGCVINGEVVILHIDDFYSREEVVPALRPYLTIDYTVPVSNILRQSKLNLGINTGIGF